MTQFAFESHILDAEESMPRAQMSELQLGRLKDLVQYATRIPFYKDAFERDGVTADSIKSLDDLRRLTPTTKEDLRQGYPLGFLAVPRAEIARLHGSSGTTGKPTFVAYTREDMDLWTNMCARFLVAGGLRPEHLVHIAFGYGLFTGGFGLHYGVERVGASVLPAASGNTPRHIMLFEDLKPDVLVCTPSYALTLIDAAASIGFDLKESSLKFAHFGGEPWTEDMRIKIEEEMGAMAFNNYGLSEIIGPGVSGECAARNGMHIQEDHFLVECVDPETLEPVAEGEQGELLFTTLTKRAMPLIRYRTRDIAVLNGEFCACGRTTTRMSRVAGRSDDMLIIRGVNVFPSQIEEALLRVEGTAPHYEIEVSRPGSLDEMTVRVEMRPEDFSDEMRVMQTLRDRIVKEIQTVAGVRANVELCEPQTLTRFEGKAQRVIDKRDLSQ